MNDLTKNISAAVPIVVSASDSQELYTTLQFKRMMESPLPLLLWIVDELEAGREVPKSLDTLIDYFLFSEFDLVKITGREFLIGKGVQESTIEIKYGWFNSLKKGVRSPSVWIKTLAELIDQRSVNEFKLVMEVAQPNVLQSKQTTFRFSKRIGKRTSPALTEVEYRRLDAGDGHQEK